MGQRSGISRLAGKSWLAPALLGVALVVWVVVFAGYRSQLGFLGDEWTFITTRLNGGVDAYLAPHNGNPVVVYAVIFRGLFEIFGFSHPFAFHLFAMAMYTAVAVTLFLYLRRLVGDGLALPGAVVVLFMGACWDGLLYILQATFSISVASGLGALLALSRNKRSWDMVACLLLVISVMTVSIGLPFLVSAAVSLIFSRDTLRRSYVVLVPLVIFTIWYFVWGRDDPTVSDTSALLGTPGFIFDAFGYNLTVLTGTFRLEGWFGDLLPAILAVLALGSIAWRVRHERRIPPELLLALAGGIAFWGMIGISQDPALDGLRGFDQPRYQQPGAVFTLMILCGGWAGVKPTVRGQAIFAAVAVVAVWVNMAYLPGIFRDWARPWSDQGRAGMTAFDLLGRDQVDPSAGLTVIPLGGRMLDAATYFALRDRFGPGGWSPDQISEQSEGARAMIDASIRQLRPFEIEKVAKRPPGACRVLRPGPDGETAAVPLTRELFFRSRGKGVLKTGRFIHGELFSVADFGGYWVRMVPPGDGIKPPWRINARGTGPVRVCSADSR